MPRSAFANESTFKTFVERGREPEFDALFDKAAEKAKSEFGREYPIYIGGDAVQAQEKLLEKSPIDSGIVLGRFQKGTREHAIKAIAAAKSAFAEWAATDYRRRASVFRKAADLFSSDKFQLSAILSYENGKSRYESMGEVDEAIDFMRYYAKELEANKGFRRMTRIAGSTAKVAAGFQGAPAGSEKITVALRPYGVFGVIAPFNFPVSISTGMCAGALITGNTVVFKPSSTDNMTMLTGLRVYELLTRAGVPRGAINYVTGPGAAVGGELAASRDVSGIAFTGSRSTGLDIVSRSIAAGAQKVFVLEMGGKNPAVVSAKADIEAAVNGVASAAFGYAGQKCSALSRLYVHESIKELFVSRLIEKTRSLKIGNPMQKGVYVGPLIGEAAFARYTEAVDKAKRTGRLLYGGGAVKVGLNGYYVEPTIAEVQHDNELVHRELFVPILTVETFSNIDDAIRMANDTEYGLTAGFYGKSANEIRRFSSGIDAGVVYINRPVSATTGAIVGMHTFVGWKGSGYTGKGTGSRFYLQQFMREQSLSVTTGS